MAVMNPMGGGIDSAVTQRMQRMGNNPDALGQQAQQSGDILDLIAARRAADLVAEQKKLLALQMNGSPSTIKDQVGEELVASQKEQMKSPLQDLRGKVQGIGGILQNQQRQQQGQPMMAAAQGGIINAPAPNLNRMYNGGIVGYAEGGLTRDEVAAYLKEVGITEAEFEAATSEEQERVVAGINKKIAEDRRGGAQFSRKRGYEQSLAEQQDVNRQSTEPFYDLFRSDPTGEELMKGREEFNPTERQDAAKRIMELPDTTIADIRGPLVNEAEFGERIAGMPGREQFEQKVAEDTDMYAADEAAAIAKADEAKRLAGLPPPPPAPLSEQEKQLNAAASAIGAGAPVVDSPKKTGITSVLPEGNGMSPVMTKKELGQKELQDLGLDKKQDISALEPFMRKPEVNPNQSPIMTPEQQAEANKPLSGSALIQQKLDAMGGKKGIAGLVERFANTNFKKSYGGTGEALAQAGRDIAETGQREKAEKRKSLEGQLAVQQSIEAADVAAKREKEKFDITEGRLTESMNNLNARQMEDLSLRTKEATFKSLAKLEELGIAKADSAGNRKYKESALALQLQANQYKQDGVISDLHRVVEGYVGSATSFYKGLIANANPGAETEAIKQELRAEIARISKMLGPDNTLDLSALERGVGATSGSGFSGFEEE